MVQGKKSSMIVQVTPAERHVLESWQRSTTINAGLHRRSRIILILADGVSVSDTARMVGVGRRHVYTWAERFSEAGPHGLEDKPGRGRKPKSAMGTASASGQP